MPATRSSSSPMSGLYGALVTYVCPVPIGEQPEGRAFRLCGALLAGAHQSATPLLMLESIARSLA